MKRVKALAAMSMAAVLTFSMSISAFAAEGFDAEYYAAQNPDVAAVVGMDPAALELHYETFGKTEGRAANAEDAAGQSTGTSTGIVSLEEFDAAYYAQQNPDVAAIYGADALSLYLHYMHFGAAEGRAASVASAAAKASAEASKKSSDSSENPYARFASSTTSSKKSSSKKSSSSSKKSSSSSECSSGSGVEHNLSYISVSSGTHEITCSVDNCQELGHSGIVGCEYDYAHNDSNSGNHIGTCPFCGDVTNDEGCQYSSWEKVDDTTHRGECIYCGHQETYIHNFSSSTGKCSDCGAECKHDWSNKGGVCATCSYTCSHTDYSYAPDSGNSGNHIPTCKVCGKVESSTSCNYGDWKKVDDSKHKKTCSDCGHEEETVHVWSDNNGTCKDCGYECTHGSTSSGNTCGTCGATVS